MLFVAFFVFYIFFETTIGKFKTLGNLVNPREIVARSGRVIATHPRGVAIFGLVWWLWNIQRWG